MNKIYVACIDFEDGGEPFIKRGFTDEDEAEKYVDELEKAKPKVIYYVDTIWLDGSVTRSHPIEMERGG